jgi:hypothetical protein
VAGASGIKSETIFTLGLVVGGLYLVYQLVQGIKGAGKAAADVAAAAAHAATHAVSAGVNTVSGALANAYLKATLPPNIVPTGAVVLPSGGTVAMSDIPGVTFDPLSNSAVFDYAGSQYLMSGAMDNLGNYIAQLVGAASGADFGLLPGTTTSWS